MDSMQIQALQVMEPDDNFDPDFEPQNGEEYLQQVIYERKKCPTIVVKPFIETNQLINVNSNIVEKMKCNVKKEIPNTLLPTDEWEEIQLKQFNNLQNYIIELRQTSAIKSVLNEKNEYSTILPDYDHHENIWLQFLQTNPPKLTIILQFDNKLLMKLLQIISKNFSKEDNLLPINFFDNYFYSLSQWLYSLLICLHLPIEPNIYNSMRLIARFFLQQRDNYYNVNNNNNEIADLITKNIIPINLFIVIITKYFKQFDLLNE